MVSFFLFSNIGLVGAQGTPEGTLQACNGLLVDEETLEVIEDTYKKTTLASKWVIGWFKDLFNFWQLNNINTLVFGTVNEEFGNPYCAWAGSNAVIGKDGVFTVEERESIIDPVLKLTMGSYVLFVTIAIMISSLKLGLNAYSPQSRQDFWEDVKMWVLSALFMVAYPQITDIIFAMNQGVVAAIDGLVKNYTGGSYGFAIASGGMGGDGFLGLGFFITFLVEWGLSLYLNFIYIARKVMIGILLMLGFVAAISLLYAKTRSFFGTWIKELASNIFLQSIHSLVLFSIIAMTTFNSSMFYKIGLMLMFIPVTGLISRWLNMGDSSTKAGQAMMFAGLSGIAGTMLVMRQAGRVLGGAGNSLQQSYNSTGSLMSMNGTGPNGPGGPTGPGGGLDSNSTFISAQSSGANSSWWQNTKNTSSKIGAMMGAVAGMPLGGVGAGAFAYIGSKVAPALLQAGRNISVGGANAIRTLNQARTDGFRNVWNNINERRKFMGNLGESVGNMFFGKGNAGRNLFQSLSGVSRQRLMTTPQDKGGFALQGENGQYVIPTWDQIQKQFPNQDVVWRQDRQGSAFYLKGDNGEVGRQLTPFGEADPNIPKGLYRQVDFRTTGGENFELQANGSYRAPKSIREVNLDSSRNIVLGSSNPTIPSSKSLIDVNGNPLTVNEGTNLIPAPMNINGVPSSNSPIDVNSNPLTVNEGTNTISAPMNINGIPSSKSSPIDVNSNPLNINEGTNPVPAPVNINGVPSSNVNVSNNGNNPVFQQPNASSPIQVNESGTAPSSPITHVNEGKLVNTNTVIPNPQTGTVSPGETVGLKGSQPHIMRTSNAYFVGADNVRYQDTNFDSSRINPSAYTSHVIQGANIESSSDRVANKLSGYNKVASTSIYDPAIYATSIEALVQNQKEQESNETRHRGIL